MTNAPEKIMITPNECEDGSQWDMIGEEVTDVLEKPYFHFPAGFEVGASYTYIRLDLHETAISDKDKRIKELEGERDTALLISVSDAELILRVCACDNYTTDDDLNKFYDFKSRIFAALNERKIARGE